MGRLLFILAGALAVVGCDDDDVSGGRGEGIALDGAVTDGAASGPDGRADAALEMDSGAPLDAAALVDAASEDLADAGDEVDVGTDGGAAVDATIDLDVGVDLDAGADAAVDLDVGLDLDAGADAAVDLDAGIDLGADPDAEVDAAPDAAPLPVLPSELGAIELPPLVLAAWIRDADDVWFAGGTAREGGAILRFDGAEIVPEALPAGPPLWWIWGADETVWASGEAGRILARRDDEWVVEETGLPESAVLWGLWGSGPDDLWAVGGSPRPDGPKGVLLRSRGDGEWRRVEDPALPDDANLFKVWGSGADDVFIVGERGVALHYDGEALIRIDAPEPARLFTVHGGEDGAVYAVGGFLEGYLYRYAAGGWIDETPAGAPGLNGVFVRDDGVAFASGEDGAMYRRDGAGWARLEHPPGLALRRVTLHAVVAGDDLWAVGGRLDRGGPGTILTDRRPLPVVAEPMEPDAGVEVDAGKDAAVEPDAAVAPDAGVPGEDAGPEPDAATPPDAEADSGPEPDAAQPDAGVADAAQPDAGAEADAAQPGEDAAAAADAAPRPDAGAEVDAGEPRVDGGAEPDAAEPDAAPDPDAAEPDAAPEPDDAAQPDAGARADAATADAAQPDAAAADAAAPDAAAPDLDAELDAALEVDAEPDAAPEVDAEPDAAPDMAVEPPLPGPGEECREGRCAEGLECYFFFWGAVELCTEPCGQPADCGPEYGEDACCFVPGPQLIQPYCARDDAFRDGCPPD